METLIQESCSVPVAIASPSSYRAMEDFFNGYEDSSSIESGDSEGSSGSGRNCGYLDQATQQKFVRQFKSLKGRNPIMPSRAFSDWPPNSPTISASMVLVTSCGCCIMYS